jgi:hypothetical protein
MPAAALPVELVAWLDEEPASALLEYLAARLGLRDGHVTLELCFERGRLARAYRHHQHGRDGLDELGDAHAPEPKE